MSEEQVRQIIREEIKKVLGDATTIPYEVKKAFEFVLPGLIANSTATGSYTEANLKRTITLSGAGEDIEVLEYPAGYIPVVFGGTTRKVPFFTD